MKPLICTALVALALLAATGNASAGPAVYIPLGSGNRVIAVDAACDTITATYPGVEHSHSLVDLHRNEGVKTIPTGPAPCHLNTIPGTFKVCVSSRSAPKIWVVDQNTLQVLGEIELPAGEGHEICNNRSRVVPNRRGAVVS